MEDWVQPPPDLDPYVIGGGESRSYGCHIGGQGKMGVAARAIIRPL